MELVAGMVLVVAGDCAFVVGIDIVIVTDCDRCLCSFFSYMVIVFVFGTVTVTVRN